MTKHREGDVVRLSLYDFLTKKYPQQKYCIDKLVPLQGTILLHGKWGVGKSPLTWAMALAVAEGLPFLGLDTGQGHVLYIEADTPEMVLNDRLVKGIQARQLPLDFLLTNAFDCLAWGFKDSKVYQHLVGAQQDLQPVMVIINTISRIKYASDSDSEVPTQIYGVFRDIFPQAGRVFVHHDHKSSTNPNSYTPPDEAFTGTQRWLDDSTVGLHMVNGKKGRDEFKLLVNTKNQWKELQKSLMFTLDETSTGVKPYLNAELQQTENYVLAGRTKGFSGRTLDAYMAGQGGYSVSTAKVKRLEYEKLVTGGGEDGESNETAASNGNEAGQKGGSKGGREGT